MPTSVHAAAKSHATALRRLVDRLELVERASREAARLSSALTLAEATLRPADSREVQSAVRLVDDFMRQMSTIRHDLVRATNAVAPQNRAQSTLGTLLANGELLESSLFREQMAWTRHALGEAVLAGRVFYLEVEGVRAFPAFYLDRRYRRTDLEAVTALLDGLSAGSKLLFFTTPKAPLTLQGVDRGDGQAPAASHARTPLQALEDGDLDLVKRAASGYAER